ncbi:NADPH-cytochrome, partial [Smittium mucronatum]
MKPVETSASLLELNKRELTLATTVLVGASTLVLGKYVYSALKNRGGASEEDQDSALVVNEERSIPDVMKAKSKDVVIIYGTQTGTSEDLAKRLSRSLQSDFSANPMVIDPQDFDVESLSRIGEDKIVVFLLSSTGDGEPTDDMVSWYNKIIPENTPTTDDYSSLEVPKFQVPESEEISPDYVYDKDKPLKNLTFASFGLGDSSYVDFNAHSKHVTRRLISLGATLLGPHGLGDGSKDTGADFAKWKDTVVPLIVDHIGLKPSSGSSAPYVPDWVITEINKNAPIYDKKKFVKFRFSNIENESDLPPERIKVDISNPWNSMVISAKHLTSPENEKSIVHIEFDISDSSMTYTTGDHIYLWPFNFDLNVDSLFSLMDVDPEQVINIVPNPDSTNSGSLPYSFNTYKNVLTFFMDVTTPTTQDTIKDVLMPNVKSQAGTEYLSKLVKDNDFYTEEIKKPLTSPGELLKKLISIETESNVPENERFKLQFDVLLSMLPRQSPRQYSISSSSLETPDKVSISVVVLKYKNVNGQNRYGVASNFIAAAVDVQIQKYGTLDGRAPSKIEPFDPSYSLRDKMLTTELVQNKDFRIPIYIRRSAFKLPEDPKIPVVMVGPGTGLAPFRGFVRERTQMLITGVEDLGATVLFFGNRHERLDFIYGDEMTDCFATLGKNNPDSKLFTAFSRDIPGKKVYVQDRVIENGDLVYKLLFEQGGYFYICGDGSRMA